MKKKSKKAKNTAKSIYVLIALILFNLMFVIHLWIGFVGILAGLVAGAFAITVSGLVTFLVCLFYPLVMNSWLGSHVSFAGVHPIAVGLLAITAVCFGLLWMIGNWIVARYFYKVSKWYVELNASIFREYGN